MLVHRFNLLAIVFMLLCVLATAQAASVGGRVLDPQGVPVAGAEVTLLHGATDIAETVSDEQGGFAFHSVAAGSYYLNASYPSFAAVKVPLDVVPTESRELEVRFTQIARAQQDVVVTAGAPAALAPDPSQNVVLRDEILNANPGRPGPPVSLPGLPVETASGGIKAPQYFAPGVAGDHGEPIAQFLQIGNFLLPNNLPANAHGNGYADPNFLIAPMIAAATVDGAAFNVREGNNSIDLATSLLPQTRVAKFAQVTGDYRDADVVAGWSPSNPQVKAWLAAEASFGNGFLERLEHRQQYKLNGEREFALGKHDLTLFGVGYYGFSYLPGLIPIDVPVAGDTIDNRQLDRTRTFLAAASDTWTIDSHRQILLSGFYRNYALTLRSNFGDGLIQQSETRNIGGGEVAYSQGIRPWLSFLAGVDVRRDAPRNLDLDHLDPQGVFQPVTSNNLTLSFVEPFFALDGMLSRYVHYNLGVRQEEVWMDNQDMLNAQNSFHRQASLTLPKGSISLLPPPDRWYLPMLAFSFGEAFHTEDPRIGDGAGAPQLLLPSRAYQLLISKTFKQTQVSITLRRVSNSQDLAKIDADTGLQEIEGPSLNRVAAVSLQQNFSHGSLFASYAQADARDVITGEPIRRRRGRFGMWAERLTGFHCSFSCKPKLSMCALSPLEMVL